MPPACLAQIVIALLWAVILLGVALLVAVVYVQESQVGLSEQGARGCAGHGPRSLRCRAAALLHVPSHARPAPHRRKPFQDPSWLFMHDALPITNLACAALCTAALLAYGIFFLRRVLRYLPGLASRQVAEARWIGGPASWQARSTGTCCSTQRRPAQAAVTQAPRPSAG